MTTNKSKIAVIGLGNIGKIVAANLIKSNRPVIVASRKPDDAKSFAKESGALATPLEVSTAIKEADIVVMAVWFDTIKELVGKYTSELKGKIIIDPSNPIAPDGNGGFKKIIGEKESAGKIIAQLLSGNAKLVKAFGSLAAASLSGQAYTKPEKVLFYTTDDASLKNKVEELIKDSGFEPLYAGGVDQSIRIEVFGDLHEYGALGKVVTLAEAKAKI
ncbi:MAG TPA: NAD(P)-binding domain-containing protein [Ohtaekwangia sp.]|uniref:NADPH-dependent F420 reductase n=1 Tax=Ohtaekwangia sp. TaxID=2066019 RepID=UPI002F95A48E